MLGTDVDREGSKTRPYVLVVDDDPDVLDALTDALGLEGYLVRGARDGIEALRIIGEHRPDLIVTDLMMPTMTGFELLGALHENPETARIPTLIITAARNTDALRSGPAKILEKPLDLDALLRAISAVTGTPGQRN